MRNNPLPWVIIATLCVCLGLLGLKIRALVQDNTLIAQSHSELQAQLESLTKTLLAKDEALALLKTPENASEQMDTIKGRYEEIFVTRLLLSSCKQTQPEDYHIINSALMRELASVNAPSRLQYDIITAAKGSYRELYATSNCASPQVTALIPGYRSYITGLRDQYGMP